MIWRQILGYLPLNIVQGLTGFGAIVILTRLLSPEDYGRYALVLAVVQLAHVACFSWLHGAMARFYAAAKRDHWLSRYLATGYVLFGSCAALVAGIYILVLSIWAPEPRLETTLYFGLGVLIMRAFLMVGLEVHKSAQHIARFAGLEMLYSLLGLGLGILIIMKTNLGAAGPLAGLALAALVCLIIDLPRQLSALRTHPNPDFNSARRFLVYGVPVSLSLILEQTLFSSDRFLIEYFLGESSVGVYAAAHALANRTLDVLFIWLAASALPFALSTLETQGTEKTRAVMRHYGEILLFITLPAAAGLALVAGPLASVMVGQEFRSAATMIIPWIALAAFMNGIMTYYIHHAFIFAERTGTMAAAMIAPVIANIVLNIFLLPSWGLRGALIATVCAYGLGLILCTVIARRYFPLPLLFKPFLRTAFAVVVMAVGVASLKLNPDVAGLALGTITGIALYGFMALLLNLADCRTFILGLRARLAALRLRGQNHAEGR